MPNLLMFVMKIKMGYCLMDHCSTPSEMRTFVTLIWGIHVTRNQRACETPTESLARSQCRIQNSVLFQNRYWRQYDSGSEVNPSGANFYPLKFLLLQEGHCKCIHLISLVTFCFKMSDCNIIPYRFNGILNYDDTYNNNNNNNNYYY